ncbi:MAG: hypothetical protein RLN76_02185 [Phycisphaeraceae bacterium]
MFKFFRQYQTIIVVVGITLLMIAFLLQDTLSYITQGSPAQAVIGTVNGRELTVQDELVARNEIQILNSITPIFQSVAGSASDSRSVRRWLLLGAAVDELGIAVSQTEIATALQAFGLDENALAQRALTMNVKQASIIATIGRWLQRERVIALMLGRTTLDVDLDPSPGLRRLTAQLQGFILQQQGRQALDAGNITQAEPLLRQANALLGIASGAQRVSRPLIEQVISDQQAAVAASFVLLRPSALGIETQPQPELLEELFTTYRDTPPGDGEPYGFGYQLLDRIKLEALVIPFDAVLAQTSVEEADALAFFRENQEMFLPLNEQGQPQEGAQPRDYREVRADIRRFLQQQKALETTQEIARAASAKLTTELRGITQTQGYYNFPDDFSPKTLRSVAEEIEATYNIRPNLRPAPSTFVNVRDLAFDPVIGGAVLPDRQPRIPITQVVASLRELHPAKENPLLTLYLQEQSPSPVMQLPSGSMLIFRVTDALPLRTPESLDEVRDQVEQDARQLAAYRTLTDQIDTWQTRATTEPLEDLASESSAAIIDTGPFPRRTRDRSGLFTVPTLPGLGQQGDLVDAIFTRARELNALGDIATLNPSERMLVQPVPSEQALAVIRVDDYEPISKRRLEAMLNDPTLEVLVTEALLDGNETRPLDLASLRKAVNFTPADGYELEDLTP